MTHKEKLDMLIPILSNRDVNNIVIKILYLFLVNPKIGVEKTETVLDMLLELAHISKIEQDVWLMEIEEYVSQIYKTEEYVSQTYKIQNFGSEVKTLAKGLKVIQLLAESDSGIGVTEVANLLEVDKSSMSRMVQTLVNHGFAEQCSDTRRYKLGSAVLNLSEGKGGRLGRIAQPLLERLSEESSECSHIAVFEQGRILILCDVESTKALRVVPDPSRSLPLHATALGKCLLAFSDISPAENLKRYTDRTIQDHEQLRLHLEQVKLQGYAVDDEEHDEGVRCLATPLFDPQGNVIASVGISGPAVRVTPKSIPVLAAIVKEIASEITLRLGSIGTIDSRNYSNSKALNTTASKEGNKKEETYSDISFEVT